MSRLIQCTNPKVNKLMGQREQRELNNNPRCNRLINQEVWIKYSRSFMLQWKHGGSNTAGRGKFIVGKREGSGEKQPELRDPLLYLTRTQTCPWKLPGLGRW